MVASSARAAGVTVIDVTTSAAAPAIARYLVLVRGLLLSNCRMVFLRCSNRHVQARVAPGSALLRLPLDGAEDRNGRAKRNQGCEPQARNLKSLPDGKGRNCVGADQADPC